jgi:hypothetical protein
VKHPGYLIVGVVVLAGAIWLAWAILRDKQLEKCFDEFIVGATERDFLQKLGRPKRVEKCGEFFEHEGVFVRVDVLQRRRDQRWRLIEVKSTAYVTPASRVVGVPQKVSSTAFGKHSIEE